MPLDLQLPVVALLVLESILIVLTLVVIWLSKTESRARMRLLDKLVAAMEVLTRREYFATSVEAIQDADDVVAGMVTGSQPSARTEGPVERILKAIEQASDRGVDVRYVLPTGRERLEMGHRYTDAGAEIRYHPGVLAGDARFMVVDEEVVVIGYPEHGGDEEPTQTGQRVHSEKVAGLFLDDLQERWDAPEAMTFDGYLATVVDDVAVTEGRVSAKRVADDLGVPVGRVEACLG